MPHKSSSQRLVQTTMDVNDGEASCPEGALCRSLSACISVVIKLVLVLVRIPSQNVKELITKLFNRLESKASSNASHKSYCDDELATVSAKKEDLQTQVATHSSMLEAAVAKSSVLDGEVAGCRRIGTLSAQQLKMDVACR